MVLRKDQLSYVLQPVIPKYVTLLPHQNNILLVDK